MTYIFVAIKDISVNHDIKLGTPTMATIADRINQRLSVLRETAADISWKDPRSPNYDRQQAEDALFHTIGPLMDSPRWSPRWTSPSTPVPGFTPGGPAPSWTENEVVMAYAGDPNLLFRAGGKDHPRSPAYGTRGGAPLWRMARSIARKFNREKDKSFIEELYQNGFVELTKLMKPGYDEGRSAFISWVSRNVEGAMENGTSATGEETVKARGDVAKDTGLIGLQGLMKAKTPEDARRVAAQIKGKYQTNRLHDKHADNPFGPYSSQIFALANNYATALEAKDEAAIAQVHQQIEKLMDKIDSDKDMILGAGTGIGQAVSNQDRKTRVGVNSMDMPTGDGEGSMGDSLAASERGGVYSDADPEAVQSVLSYALSTDIGGEIGTDPEFMQMAASFGLKPGEKIGGPMSATELRCILRKLGPLAAEYPGKGKMRKALNVPRDGKGWWSPGEDPEIEAIPAGGSWHSIWSRKGCPEMENVEIGREFTMEYKEFAQLGIQGLPARVTAAQAGKEVLSKVSIGHAVNGALLKVKLAAQLQRLDSGIEENLARKVRGIGIPLMEDFDPIDRRLLNEAWNFVIRKLTNSVVMESNLSGEQQQAVIEDAAISWSLYNKGK